MFKVFRYSNFFHLEKYYINNCIPSNLIHIKLLFRYSDPNNIIKKNVGEPIPAYDNWRESETLERLESIRTNHHGIHMEALAVRERILGL